MTKAEARRLAPALEAAGVIRDAAISTLTARLKGLRQTHGASTIEGMWPSGRHAVITCVDVAEELTGGWSVEALRACGHTPGSG